jgi:eukaryotic-like serine/threonine-protein kinase
VTQDSPATTQVPEGLPIAPGQLIGERYLVGQLLGGGGMGVVFSGTHVLLGTPVAVKLIHSELKNDAEAVQRFLNEARTTAALKGEHIARVFDVGLLDSGEPYIVMEHLEGLGLDQYLQDHGPLSQAEAVDIVLQACEGLAEAHAAALVHRDVKPANLFLARRPDGQFSVKILDFGIAKRKRSDEPGLTDPGKSLGSPWYMSPEQMLTAHTVDERADVWSLGVLLFELLTNRRPFDGESVPQVCGNVLTAPAPRISEFRGDVQRELDNIVLCCLEKEPASRFRSVSQLAEALLPFASAPAHTAGIALESVPPPPETIARGQARSYGSFRPMGADVQDSEPRRTRWPPMLTLLVVSLIVGGWLQYRDPTLLHRAVGSARAFTARPLHLRWDPQLLPGPPASEPEPAAEPHATPKTIHHARAVPERDRESTAASGDDGQTLSPEEVQQRVERYEDWLRARGLERLNGH